MDKRAQIIADWETDLERVSEIASIRFNAEVKATLDDWASRFPRHTFTAWEGHGRMSVDISPPVFGQTDIGCMNTQGLRGAIVDLAQEAQALVGWFNSMETRVSVYCAEYRTR